MLVTGFVLLIKIDWILAVFAELLRLDLDYGSDCFF